MTISDIIRQMKYYLRRWWIINRLYHFSRGVGVIWVDEYDFASWIIDKPLEKKVVYPHTPPNYNWIHKFGLKFLLDSKADETLRRREIRNLIADCEEKDVGWIERPEPEVITNHLTGEKIQFDNSGITISTLGIEKYAFTHLINLFFSNGWVRGVGIALIIWFATDKIGEIFPSEPLEPRNIQRIQIEYVEPTQQVSTTTRQSYIRAINTPNTGEKR